MARLGSTLDCMVSKLRALLQWADAIAARKLLFANLGIACLVGIAHGGALAISMASSKPDPSIQFVALLSLPLVSVIALSAVYALLSPTRTELSLGLHGLILGVGALALLGWAASLLINGFPSGPFSWSPGMLSALIGYAFFLASRHSTPANWRAKPLVVFAPAIAFGVALLIDIAVFAQLIRHMQQSFR